MVQHIVGKNEKSGVQKFALNIWSLTLSQFLYRGVSLGLAVYLARLFGASDLGAFYTAIGLISIFTSFTDFGFSNLIIKEVSRDRSLAQQYLNNFFSIQLIVGTCFIGFIISTGYIIGYPTMTMYALIIGSTIPLITGLANCFNALLSAHELLYPFAMIEVVCMLVYAAVNVVLMLLGMPILYFVAALVVTALVKLGLAFVWGAKFHLFVHLRFERKVIGHLFVLGFPFFLFNGIHYALQRIDVVIVSLLATDLIVGHYAGASRLIFSTIFIASIGAAALYPTLARMLQTDTQRTEFITNTAAQMLFALGSIIAVFCSVGAGWIIPLLYGPAFTDTIIPFAILSWVVPVFSFGIVYGNVLLVGEKVYRAVATNFLSLVILCGSCFIVYPSYGLIGIAVVVVIAETVRAIFFSSLVYRYHRFRIAALPIILSLLGSSLAIALGITLNKFSFVVGMSAALMVVVFSGMISGTINRRSVMFLFDLFVRRSVRTNPA